jgi:hypothetical protein
VSKIRSRPLGRPAALDILPSRQHAFFVSDAAALAEIKRLAGLDRIQFRVHALDRMDERGASSADVRQALMTAIAAIWQADRGNHRVVGGGDGAGDDMTVIVSIEADLIVITIF